MSPSMSGAQRGGKGGEAQAAGRRWKPEVWGGKCWTEHEGTEWRQGKGWEHLERRAGK